MWRVYPDDLVQRCVDSISDGVSYSHGEERACMDDGWWSEFSDVSDESKS